MVNVEHLDELALGEYDCYRRPEWRANVLSVAVLIVLRKKFGATHVRCHERRRPGQMASAFGRKLVVNSSVGESKAWLTFEEEGKRIWTHNHCRDKTQRSL